MCLKVCNAEPCMTNFDMGIPELRVYPFGFGQRLLQLWLEDDVQPRAALRTRMNISNVCNLLEFIVFWCVASNVQKVLVRKKIETNDALSDRELFQILELKDPWSDADMASVFVYMMDHEKTKIPDSWLGTMRRFRIELLKETTCDLQLLKEYNRIVALSGWCRKALAQYCAKVVRRKILRPQVPRETGAKKCNTSTKTRNKAQKKKCSFWFVFSSKNDATVFDILFAFEVRS